MTFKLFEDVKRTSRHLSRRSLDARHIPRAVHPLDSAFLLALAFLFSFLFIVSVCCAFIGAQDEAALHDALFRAVSNNTGIVLFGHDVDVDIDEPSVSIQWLVLACGQSIPILPSDVIPKNNIANCGLPAISLEIYIDGIHDPLFHYEPSIFPVDQSSGKRRTIQSLSSFGSDHTLDVHRSYLYPFDTYRLTTSIRVLDTDSNLYIPVVALPVNEVLTSFVVQSSNEAGTVTLNIDGKPSPVPARNLELRIKRPGAARLYTMMLFSISWILVHVCCGLVSLSLFWDVKDLGTIHAQLAMVMAVLLILPQLRSAMPDAPGFDGTVVDLVGYFPQMVFVGLSAICILLGHIKRSLDLWIGHRWLALDKPAMYKV